MKIKKFEKYTIDDIYLNDVSYELCYVNSLNGDTEVVPYFDDDDDYDVNPFDLKETVKLYLKYEKDYENIFILKKTEEKVDDSIIEEVKKQLDIEKYNL
jgi:hypothetical protein